MSVSWTPVVKSCMLWPVVHCFLWGINSTCRSKFGRIVHCWPVFEVYSQMKSTNCLFSRALKSNGDDQLPVDKYHLKYFPYFWCLEHIHGVSAYHFDKGGGRTGRGAGDESFSEDGNLLCDWSDKLGISCTVTGICSSEMCLYACVQWNKISRVLWLVLRSLQGRC